MMDDPDMWVHTVFDSNLKPISSATVFPTYRWVALGTYFNKTGGLDVVPNIATVELLLHSVCSLFPDYDVLMEGILCSTTFSSYSTIFRQMENTYDRQPIILSIMPPVEVAIDRVKLRNGGKPFNEDLVRAKWGMVYRSHQKFKSAGFCTVKVDSSKIRKESMLPAFLRTVDKYREEK